jgi:hypothetical protein
MSEQTHRHVFFADADAPDAGAEWVCACGLVAVREGHADGDFVVISGPSPRDLDALADGADPLLVRVLEGLETTGSARRSA